MKKSGVFRAILGNSGFRWENMLRHGIPREARAAIVQSEAARLRGDLSESARHLRRALEIYPNFPAALNLLGIYWRDEGHDDLAGHYFRKAMEIDPGFVAARLNLGASVIPGPKPAAAGV